MNFITFKMPMFKTTHVVFIFAMALLIGKTISFLFYFKKIIIKRGGDIALGKFWGLKLIQWKYIHFIIRYLYLIYSSKIHLFYFNKLDGIQLLGFLPSRHNFHHLLICKRILTTKAVNIPLDRQIINCRKFLIIAKVNAAFPLCFISNVFFPLNLKLRYVSQACW